MSLFRSLSDISRKSKLELFYKIFTPNKNTLILDVGAEIDPKGNRNLQFIDSYPWKSNISAINLSSEHVSFINKTYPEIDVVSGDACKLPWPDKHFDIVLR